jgi:uncharacterized protein (DUF111 family)
VLQALLGEEETRSASPGVRLLEANLDDCDPRLVGPLMEQLLEAGALDAWITPVQMKKGRPGFLVSALAPASEAGVTDGLARLLLRETTTLGVRFSSWERVEAEREVVPVETPYGRIGVKVGRLGGEVVNVQPEFEECAEAATRSGAAVKVVLQAAVAAWERQSG